MLLPDRVDNQSIRLGMTNSLDSEVMQDRIRLEPGTGSVQQAVKDSGCSYQNPMKVVRNKRSSIWCRSNREGEGLFKREVYTSKHRCTIKKVITKQCGEQYNASPTGFVSKDFNWGIYFDWFSTVISPILT